MEIPRFSTDARIAAASVAEGVAAFALTTAFFGPSRGFLMGLDTALITFCLLESDHAAHEAIRLDLVGNRDEEWPTYTGGMMLAMMGSAILSATLAFAATRNSDLGTFPPDRGLETLKKLGIATYVGSAGGVIGGAIYYLGHKIGLRRASGIRNIPASSI